MHWYIPPNASR